jgi:hypothetical protein
MFQAGSEHADRAVRGLLHALCALCRFGLLLGLLLLVLTVVGGAMLLHYWNHPEALPYSTLQQLQSMAQTGAPLQQACSAGSFPLHQQVCSWVARAVRVLPDDQYMEAMHDEL